MSSAHRFVPRRPLGRTGFSATILGLGDVADRSVPLADCVATLRRGLEAGLNVVDTAPAYEGGYSEQIVGEALKGRSRDSVFVIDKVDRACEPVTPQVEASLARLQIDHADLFVFHGVSKPEDWSRLAAPGGGMEQLEDCVRRGRCRFRGISSHNPGVLLGAIASGSCDAVLFPIGPFADPRYEREVLPLARERGVGTVCFKTFGAGKLLGDTEGYGRPLSVRPRGKLSSGGGALSGEPECPHLSVDECVRYTLTVDPDVALLGLSFPNEQDAAFAAAAAFAPLSEARMEDARRRAAEAVKGKGPCWWNP
ncbi:MAG: aldo/keto reductase [Spirochaetes bacterium RBG_13_68_11]|nr:MAG: aldo/keto reductase [Spirochaetes bacterium RBG_13_68_11]